MSSAIRHHRTHTILGAVVLAVLGGSLVATPRAGEPSPRSDAHSGGSLWKAVAASGPVEALGHGTSDTSWRQVIRGSELLPLSQVRTGRRGRVTLTRNASVLIVDPQSRLELPDVSSGAPPRVVQRSGSVIYEVDGTRVNGFQVVTPYLVAGVKGTVFLVTVTERFASVSVDEGTVWISSSSTNESREIHAGETLVLHADEGAEMEILRNGTESGEGTPGVSKDALRAAREDARRLAERKVPKDDGEVDLEPVPDLMTATDADDRMACDPVADEFRQVASQDLLIDELDPIRSASLQMIDRLRPIQVSQSYVVPIP